VFPRILLGFFDETPYLLSGFAVVCSSPSASEFSYINCLKAKLFYSMVC